MISKLEKISIMSIRVTDLLLQIVFGILPGMFFSSQDLFTIFLTCSCQREFKMDFSWYIKTSKDVIRSILTKFAVPARPNYSLIPQRKQVAIDYSSH